MIRGRPLTPQQRQRGHAFRARLDELDHALEAQTAEKSQRLALATTEAYRQLRDAYMGTKSSLYTDLAD